ncbi:hypothetical protein ACJJIF_15045 [Microbulbifer sp. SSSA002]|uniref:hypothetical protein n=1 Tax=Microbulbifer sp. SSSA002 TaxID=3243376 RepID=UPI00403A23C7
MSSSSFEGKKPEAMVEFLSRFSEKDTLPASFHSSHDRFLLSVQYLFNDCWSNRFNPNNNLLKFAVSTDGWDLLINPEDEELIVFQDEVGDIDSIDITIFDLLNAKVEKI